MHKKKPSPLDDGDRASALSQTLSNRAGNRKIPIPISLLVYYIFQYQTIQISKIPILLKLDLAQTKII